MNIQAKKYSKNPILTPRVQENSFEKACVYNPAAIVKDDKVYLLYRAEQGYYASYNSRIGLAVSNDGLAFERAQDMPIIDIDEKADPTAVRQEVVKKLNQYVSSSPVSQRSDAALTMKEASSPSPNVQILPALIKLTKDAVALDRVEALMPNAFKGNNYDKYIKNKKNIC